MVYTGTHDNDTLQGWLEKCDEELLTYLAQYFYAEKIDFAKAKKLVSSGALRKKMMTSALASSAVLAVIPMQDIIGIDNQGRMNTPSTTGSNWSWRMKKSDLKENAAEYLAFTSELYGRNL